MPHATCQMPNAEKKCLFHEKHFGGKAMNSNAENGPQFQRNIEQPLSLCGVSKLDGDVECKWLFSKDVTSVESFNLVSTAR